MKRLLAATIIATFAFGILRGQEVPQTQSAERPLGEKVVAVEKLPTGENVLMIQYPWRMHQKPSIEVRLITDEKDFNARVNPLQFSTLRFESPAERRIYEAMDHAGERPVDWKADAGRLMWRIIGRGNHLGRNAVWFVHASDQRDLKLGTTAAFSPLDPWAVGDRLLLLDLPHDAFGQPGKLHVWFLRGNRLLWHEELMWPGQK